MRLLSLKVTLVLFAVLFATTSFTKNSVAQGGAQSAVLQTNQQAMTAYGNLQFDQALNMLKQAEAMCIQQNIKGTALARTYANMGVVEYGGNGNNAGALEYFKKALCLDMTVKLDPMNSTPDMDMLFTGAKNQVSGPGACSGASVPSPSPAPPPAITQPQPQPSSTGMQLIHHTQILQQARLQPIPIFATINNNVQVGKVILFYRTIGERIFQQVPMHPHSNGYAALIGCDVLQTFDPTGIDYYIAALDPNDQLLGTAGTEAAPLQISIVQVLTTMQPTLPNEPPPPKCQEECPPWNPNCNTSCKSFGDLCDSNADCCPGMLCLNETCTGTDDEDEDTSDYNPHMRMSLSFGTGAGLIKGGAEKPYNQLSTSELTIGTGFAMNKLHFRINPMFYLPSDAVQLGITFRGGIPLEFNYTEIPKLVPSVLANISFRLAGKKNHKGFQLHLLTGIGYMKMYHKVPYQDCPPQDDGVGGLVCEQTTRKSVDNKTSWNGKNPVNKTFFKESGAFGMELGLDAYYWVANGFGLNFGVIADMLAPNFALNFDLQLGIAVRF